MNWSECFFIYNGTAQERLTFRPMDAISEMYKQYPTPEGPRAILCRPIGPNREGGPEQWAMLMRKLPKQTELTVRGPETMVSKVGQPVKLDFTCVNQSTEAYSGEKPRVNIRMALFEGKWANFLGHKVDGEGREIALDASWNSMAVGQSRQGSVEFVAPQKPGLYRMAVSYGVVNGERWAGRSEQTYVILDVR